MTNKKLENLAYRLQDMNSLRDLFSELNFDFEDKPVNKDNWNDEQKQMVLEARVIAKKKDYKIYYIQTDTDSLKQWKGISSKIIKDNQGFCMVCSHNPGGFKWVFSSLSKEFSKSFSETRHVPIDIKPNVGVPKTFVDFLEGIRIGKDSAAISIISQISSAFDTFAIQIHDELTVNVFEALKILAEGIISDKSNNLTLNEQVLTDIREPTFILLYRIMFVLYAEDRSIFPEEKFYYDNFSLKWIKNNWILKSDHSVEEYMVQKRIQKLFRLIEIGSEELDYKPEEFFMRSYYGRLFDRKIHSKLERWNIPNKNLLDAIGLLTRTCDKKGNYFFLDYAALETRHLGAIYEHLLEYHLTVKDGKVDDLPNPKERKSTGSYYTPQYIVDYIVENTVGPLIDNIVKNTDDPSEQIDNILDLNVLDPAMGSGHFLVGATNYIAKRICQIEYGEDVTEQAFVERKRDVARRCVYGVDINPLAVDLASVSLWLETLSSEKPLSFLSAHLKSGNSLIGSSINGILEKQTTLIESARGRTQFKKIVRDFIMLETLDDDTAQTVKAKTVKYTNMQEKGTTHYKLRVMLDAKVAKLFGIDVPPIGDFVHKIGEGSLDFYSDKRWRSVEKVSEEHSFFHWDLEFLDIFYGEDGKRKKNPGFDAVVGNPPYFNLTSDHILKKISDYNELKHGVLNSAALFMKKGMNLLCKDDKEGFLGFIIPKSFLIIDSWKHIRDFILDKIIISVNDVGKQWKNVGLEQVIIVVKNKSRNDKTPTNVLTDFKLVNVIPQRWFKEHGGILTGLNKEMQRIVDKMENKSVKLATIAAMPRGAYVPKSEYIQKSKNSCHVLGGTNVERYLIKNGNKRKPNRYLTINDPKLKSKQKIFEKKGIIYQRLTSSVPKIVATIENKKRPTDDTLHNLIITDNDYSYNEIAAILNSDLMTFYLRYAIINNSTLTIDLDVGYMGKIPIKRSTNSLSKQVLTIIKNKQIISDKRDELFKIICNDVEPENTSKKLKLWHSLDFKEFLYELKKQKINLKSKDCDEYKKDFYRIKKNVLELKNQIQKANDELNRIVYETYSLCKEEIQLIEGLIKKDHI